MIFNDFKVAVDKQMAKMQKHPLLTVDVSKDELRDVYLASFPEGSDPLQRVRTEHNCSCCKQFIRAAGNMVAIINGKLVTIWDIELEDSPYKVVADALASLVRSKKINGPFYHYLKSVGTDVSRQHLEGEVITWTHFYHVLPSASVIAKASIATTIGKKRTSIETYKRALSEISTDAIETVLELIDQGSLYKGPEYRPNVNALRKAQVKFNAAEDKEIFVWSTTASPALMGIRNSSIGTLLIDLSADMELNKAVERFETVVDPVNYKRPTALITKAMVTKAEEKVTELGLTDALYRRYAIMEDITINNVIFANRASKKTLGAFDSLKADVPDKMPEFSKIEEVTIDSFLADILPKAVAIEVLVENKHVHNMVSLIAPIHADAPNILKWDNNFSWSYTGEVTDSMKERVKSAGGAVDGILRCSIQWNEEGSDKINDLDVHCSLPGAHIYYSRSKDSKSGGWLDVDITQPVRQCAPTGVAVENISWQNLAKMPDGDYNFYVHNYSGRNSKGFRAQIEMDGVLHEFSYDRPVTSNVPIATVTLKNGKFTIKCDLDSSISAKEVWNISTQKFQNVSVIMNSPNYWDQQKKGNRHVFFMLTDCVNPDESRGLYNEFLKPELDEHRKVFEMLGSKLKAPETEEQLSGIGFSSTIRNSIVCRVKGIFNRTIKINF